MISLPYWHDCLKFSGRGVLVEMRRAAAQFEEELGEEHSGIDDVRDRVRTELGLIGLPDPLKELHESLNRDAGFSVVSKDGLIFESLFGPFTLDQRLVVK